MSLASIFLFFRQVNFACILVYFTEDVKLTKAHCLQCLTSKHNGQVCVFWDTSLQKLNEGKRKAGNASLILLAVNVNRIEIVPEEW